jgi:hypothetical protein
MKLREIEVFDPLSFARGKGTWEVTSVEWNWSLEKVESVRNSCYGTFTRNAAGQEERGLRQSSRT